MNDRRILSRRQMLKTMAATGALAAADLACGRSRCSDRGEPGEPLPSASSSACRSPSATPSWSRWSSASTRRKRTSR